MRVWVLWLLIPSLLQPIHNLIYKERRQKENNSGRSDRNKTKAVHTNSALVQATVTKASQTAWLINNRHLFLNILEAEVKDQGARMVLLRALFGVADGPCLGASSHGAERKGEESSLVGLVRALIPFTKAPLSGPHLVLTASQRYHLIGREGFNIRIWGGGTKHSVYSDLHVYMFTLIKVS